MRSAPLVRPVHTKLAPVTALFALLVALGWAQAADAASSSSRQPPTLAGPGSVPKGDGSLGQAARQALDQGYLVPDQRAYDGTKAEAARKAARNAGEAGAGAPSDGSLAPVALRSWNGIRDTGVAPSDSTSAVGKTRFIELINRRFAIYNKTSNSPIDTGTLNQLAGVPAGHNVFDPQVIWDPGTNRFYYAADDVASASDNRVAFGFSTTASPNSQADWCHYNIQYGSFFPDYPKLGDSRHFVTVGVNTFAGNSFVGSDLLGVSKPPAGSACPAAGTFDFGSQLDIRDSANNRVFTPVAVNQTDTATAGWFVARPGSLPDNKLVLYKVTRNPDGTPNFGNPANLAVPTFTVPANAPQAGTAKVLDTLDARNTQAVSAIDPAQGNANAIWTQHTVNGAGGRSQVRWYEIRPAGPRTVLQSGRARSGSLFAFNGAISPDRAVAGATKTGGDAMVLGFNTSSATRNPAVRMLSKVGAGAQSGFVLVRNSPGFYTGFDCAGGDNLCRWGDYAAATPNPRPPAGTNQVWLTSMYASGGTSTAQANWLTRNWAATP